MRKAVSRLRAALREGEYQYERHHGPPFRFPFGGLCTGCLQLILIGTICGLVTVCVTSYLLILALR